MIFDSGNFPHLPHLPLFRPGRKVPCILCFQKKMLNYAGSTGDDVMIRFVPAKGTKCISAKYTTNTSLLTPEKMNAATQTSTSTQTTHLNKSKNKTSTTQTSTSTKRSNDNDEDVCRICTRRSGTVAEKKFNSQWVNCSVDGCTYWVHTKCVGFYPKDEEDMRDLFYKSLSFMYYFCPKHLPSKPRSNILRPNN